MKKIITILLALMFSFSLASCNEEVNPNGKKKITISYADWGDAVTNQKMIDAFMVKYPHITVKLRDDIAGTGAEFTGNLVDASQAGMLPDVFATDNVPTVVVPGLTLDVTSYWDADDDAKKVYENAANTAVYNGKRYAIPSFQFLKGILINLTLFEKADLRTVEGKYRMDAEGYPVKDWTQMEMVEIAKAITNYDVNDKANFVSGLGLWYGAPDFQQTWPMMDDETVGYDTWDGTKFNYNSAAWIDAMKVKVDIMNNVKYPGVTSNFPQADLEFVTELGWMIATGYQALQIDGTWNFGAINQAKENGQTLGFWPYPSGDAGFFPPTILDYQCVSSQTRYPDEAYLLAKWMTYGEDGWNARMDILETAREAQLLAGDPIVHLDRFPVADYPEVWERVSDFIHDAQGNELVPGMQYILDNIDKSKPDLDKWLAGYKDFWTWATDETNNASWCWQELLRQGPDAVPQFAVEWNKQANQIVQNAIENLGK